jgi:hypothetical protein
MTDPVQPAPGEPPSYDPAPGPGPAPRPGAGLVTPGVLPLASVIAKPASSSGRGTSLLLVLAGAIAIGGLAFAGGRLTAPAAATTFRAGGQLPGGGQGFAGRGDGFGGGISLSGTVSAVSADSITLDLASGTSITLPLDGKTAYRSATAATASDVRVGSEVRVTPGGRVTNPGASRDPNASPGPGAGGITFGAASDVTVVEP